MRKINFWIAFLLIFLIGSPLNLVENHLTGNAINDSAKDPNQYDTIPNYLQANYIEHAAIEITNDAELASAANGGGTGDINDPYIIENYNITIATGNAIYIHDTTKHFKIKDCFIEGGDQGILLDSATNGTIQNTTISSCKAPAIRVSTNSDNVQIRNNTIFNCSINTGAAAILVELVENSTVQNNTLYLNNGLDACVKFRDCVNNTFIENMVRDNLCNGLEFGNANQGRIHNNTFYNNSGTGINLEASNYYNITHNAIFNNEIHGINMGADYCNITHNTIYNNSQKGIRIIGIFNFLNISYNNLIENFYHNDDVEPPYGQQIEIKDASTYIFEYNFWHDHLAPDENEDDIVDIPRHIDSLNQDSFAKVKPYNYGLIHILTRPLLINNDWFFYGLPIKNSHTIEWNNSYDSWGSDVTYRVWYSDNNGSDWYILSDYISETSYVWDTTQHEDGIEYLIKIVSNSTSGLETSFCPQLDFCIHNNLMNPVFINCSGGELLWGSFIVDWENVTDPVIEHLGLEITYILSFIDYQDDPPIEHTIEIGEASISQALWHTEWITNSSEIKLNITVECSDGLVSSALSGYITVINEVSMPEILTNFEGRYSYDDTINLNWRDSVDVQERPITYDLYYSPNYGYNWILITSGLTESQYTWSLQQVNPTYNNLIVKVSTMIDNAEITMYESSGIYVVSEEDKGDNIFIRIILILAVTATLAFTFLKLYKKRVLDKIRPFPSKSFVEDKKEMNNCKIEKIDPTSKKLTEQPSETNKKHKKQN
ncbi:MAG: hypothetical protein GF364_21890 [Candidatus Lokiarchaeota archaeon]|nr:hypothetical protein [Candidatus Lokiarchaeota archaeon]